MFKKIIALFATIAIMGSSAFSARALTVGEIIEGGSLVVGLFDSGLKMYELWREANPDADPSEYPGFGGGGSFSFQTGGARGQWEEAYDTYVSDLQTDLGSTVLIDGGIRCYFSPTGAGGTNLSTETVWNLTPTSVTGTIVTNDLYSSTSGDHASNATLRFVYKDGIKAPFTCTYQYGDSGSFSSSSVYNILSWPNKNGTGEANKGTFIYAASSVYNGVSYVRSLEAILSAANVVIGDIEYSVWVDLFPASGLSSVTTMNVDQSTRVGSLVGDFVSDNDSTVYKDVQIVDEANGTYYNPVTGNYNTITNWSYDYSDRSYTVTTDSNNTYTITYGDEHVTINEGDTIYNLYYTVPDSGSGDGSGGGSGDSGGGIGGAIDGLLGTIGNIIGGLISGLINMANNALEALTGLGDLFKQLGKSVMGFFSGYIGFLAAVFPFLPEETFIILNLGLILLIAAAVFRKFLK